MFTIDIFKDQSAPAFALLVCVLKKYGFEALEWDPSLLRQDIEKEYNLVLSDLQHDKIQAAILLLSTNSYETYWPAFEKCNHIFNNDADDFDTLNPLEAEELITGFAEASLIKQAVLDKDEPFEFSEEIRAYAGVVFHDYGMHSAPELFSTAIMPTSVKCDDKEKNLALAELFDAHAERTLQYLDKL